MCVFPLSSKPFISFLFYIICSCKQWFIDDSPKLPSLATELTFWLIYFSREYNQVDKEYTSVKNQYDSESQQVKDAHTAASKATEGVQVNKVKKGDPWENKFLINIFKIFYNYIRYQCKTIFMSNFLCPVLIVIEVCM